MARLRSGPVVGLGLSLTLCAGFAAALPPVSVDIADAATVSVAGMLSLPAGTWSALSGLAVPTPIALLGGALAGIGWLTFRRKRAARPGTREDG